MTYLASAAAHAHTLHADKLLGERAAGLLIGLLVLYVLIKVVRRFRRGGKSGQSRRRSSSYPGY